MPKFSVEVGLCSSVEGALLFESSRGTLYMGVKTQNVVKVVV